MYTIYGCMKNGNLWEKERKMQEKGLILYEEHSVNFYGDHIISIKDETEKVWVPIKRPCEYLGIDVDTQRKKIQKDPKFSCGLKTVRDSRGSKQDMFCLQLECMPGWLFSINANRVVDKHKSKLLLYQQECFAALNSYWSRELSSYNKLDVSIDSIKLVIQETVDQTINKLIETHYLPRELQQRVLAQDVEMLLSVSKSSSLSDWANRRIKDYVDDYLCVSPEIDISRIVMGITPLTPELLSRLHLGEKWCLDKIMLYFPREVPTKKQLKCLCEQNRIPVQNYSYPINELLRNQFFRDQHQYKRRVEDMVMFYNLSKETITRNCNSVRKNLETIFRNNYTKVVRDGYDSYIKSAYWYNKRNAFRSIFNVCWDCNSILSPTNIVVHHLTYDKLGHENLDDLVTLCRECHYGRHPEKRVINNGK